jgi:WD40 repeat protein/transcriptional regulator with XRE-family HTH domain
MDSTCEPPSFRSLLLRDRGRTGLIQRDLAARAGASLRSLQDWEAGVTLPSAERLQGLIRALLEAGGLSAGLEMAEARELWTAVERDASRMHTPFDEAWFSSLSPPGGSDRRTNALTTVSVAEPATGAAARVHNWGEAPDTTAFIGRAEELALLEQWVLEERCRVVAILGMGGIGKTHLAVRLAQTVAPSFERVYWRSVRNAPPVSEWLSGAIGFLSDQQLIPPASESERITCLLQLLRSGRCLLVLDNSETLFEPGEREGRYRAGMDGYGQLLQAIGESSHSSCMLLTSREAPPELAVLGVAARSLELHGLGAFEARALLSDKQLHGDERAWLSLVDRYGGNGLALKIVGETIRQVFNGDVGAFLEDAPNAYGMVFGGIRRLLDTQLERLSPVEYDVLTRLAVEREPVTLAELSNEMAPNVGRSSVVEAIENLRRRSLVERGERAATFTLQSMVLECVSDRLVEIVADEIGQDQPNVLIRQPLIKAQAKDFVRQTQERLIGAPLLQRLRAQIMEPAVEPRLLVLLGGWRGRPVAEQGYGPGNVVNLLRLLRGDLRGLDLSQLALRQVYLQGVDAQDASLAGSGFTDVVMDEAFNYPTTIAISADGALIAAGTPTGEVRVWRAADRTLLMAMQRQTGVIWSVALSADGRRVASAEADGMVRIWDSESGQLMATLEGHSGVVMGVALSGDGRLVASGGMDGTVRLWNPRGGKLMAILEGHAGGVRAVALSADGRLVASGDAEGRIRLWDPGSGSLLANLEGKAGPVFSTALSADGRLLASGGAGGTIELWQTESRQLLATFQGHGGAVLSVAISTDGRLVASGGTDGIGRLWDAANGQLIATLHGHTNAVLGVALSADGALVATASWDGRAGLWDARSGQLLVILQGHSGMVSTVTLSMDERLVASGSVDGKVRLWEAATGKPAGTLAGHTGAVNGVRLSGDGRLMASGGADGTVRLWETGSGQVLATLDSHAGAVWSVALSGDGRLVASGGVDGNVRLWESRTEQLMATLRAHAGLVWSVALSADGGRLASGGADGVIRVWDTTTSGLLASVRGHNGAGVPGVALSGDGRLLATGGSDGTVCLWEADSGQLVTTLQGHTGAALCVALSADGRLVASGSADGMGRLWEATGGQLVATLKGHTGVVLGVALSGDGQLAATGGDDGSVRLWDAATGMPVQALRGDRHYQRLDITGLTGVTEAQRAALLALGAIEVPGSSAVPPRSNNTHGRGSVGREL